MSNVVSLRKAPPLPCLKCGKELPNHTPECDVTRYWAMFEDDRVIDLNKQLHEGLIHPIEYAQKVEEIAIDFNLGWRQ